jgi:DNA transposition AAA+ family ATPase
MIQRTAIQQAVNDALGTGISQRQLASQIGISDATLINIKRGEWDEKVSDQMAAKVQHYFRIDTWNIRNTRNYASISALCKDAQQNRRFLGVAGYTGAGKTTALRHYQRTNNHVFYVLATVLHTKRTFVRSIQQSMGLNDGGSIAEMMDAIIRKLVSTADALLIIDDAGKLSNTCLRLLQVIYDATEGSAGMVIGGTEFLKSEIDRQASRKVMGFDELRRRIAYWQPLYRPTKKVVQTIASDYGITDSYALNYLIAHAKDYGTLRNMIENAEKLSQERNLPVSREILADLHVGDMAYEALA